MTRGALPAPARAAVWFASIIWLGLASGCSSTPKDRPDGSSGADGSSEAGQDHAGVPFSLRANGGLPAGQVSSFDGKTFLPLTDYLSDGQAHNSDEALKGNYPIAGTPFPALYQTETWIPREVPATTFTFAVPDGSYSVHLHFVDWVKQATGERVFHVELQGQRVIDNLDIVAEAGKSTALIRSFQVSVADGKLRLGLITVTSWPEIAGVEIVMPGQPYLGQEVPLTAPAGPTGLSATPLSESSVALSWTDHASDETTYEVQWRLTGQASFGAPVSIGADATSHQVTGLQADSEYVFRVAARNGAGLSPYSNQASARTLPAQPITCSGPLCRYVDSAGGDDANPGDDPTRPWKSLARVNAHAPPAGAQILFKRGGAWEGTLTAAGSGTAASPVTYGAYGSGPKPRLYGSQKITGWAPHSGSIYKAPFSGTVNQLFVDGVRMKVARSPNTGYFLTDAVAGSTKLTSNSLDGNFDYAGAAWFGRMNAWLSDTSTVTASSAKTLTLSSVPVEGLGVGKGFFLMNKLAFLDTPGEWYHDQATSTVYLWTPTGGSPASHEVRGSVHKFGVYISNRQHLVVRDLELSHAADAGIRMGGVSNDHVTLDSNDILYPAGYGVWDPDTSLAVTVKNNTVIGANGIGIYMWNESSTVSNNRVSEIALFDALGLEGTWRTNGGAGMEISGNSNTISQNRIEKTNSGGMFYRGTGVVVEHNFIDGVCLVKDDGGGIYTNTTGTGSTVRNNIVLNSVGNQAGGTQTRAFGNGIYIDESAENVIVEGNTIAHCSNGGIFLHDNKGSEVKNNTIMDARYGVLVSVDRGGNSVHHNIIYVLDQDDYEPNQLLVNWNGAYPVLDYNAYVNHYNTAQVFRKSGAYHSFTGWRSATGQDAHSSFDSSKLGVGEAAKLFYNDTMQPRTINLGSTPYRDLDGNPVSATLTLQPFKSKILIGK